MDRLNVRTIILFGSITRSDFRDTSDIDLLLVASQKLKLGEVKRLIPKSLIPKGRQIGLSIYSEDEFSTGYRKGSLFFVHLLNEGIVIYDDGFFRKLLTEPFFASKKEMDFAMKILKRRLEVTKDLTKFNNLFVGVLADYYTIFKNASFTLLAKNDQFIFNKKKAFSELAKKYPKYEKEIRKLLQLEPFFLRSAKGISKSYPFSPNDKRKVIEMREHIEKLVSLGVEHHG